MRHLKSLMIAALMVAVVVLCSACPQPQETTKEAAAPGAAETVAATSGYQCSAPYVLPSDLASQDQVGADGFAWQTFLALSAAGATPQWSDWLSTVDVINCNQDSAPAGGTCENGRFYPTACQSIEGYDGYDVVDQIGKVDDDFEEAQTQGLSSNPVLASNGTFLRYQIVVSPSTSDWIVLGGLQKESTLSGLTQSVDFPCPTASDADQSIVLKLAWMEVGACGDPAPADSYSQDLLVYTPSYRNSSGEETCSCRKLALVGMHVLRKTNSQPAWVWATFEHADNAPDCTALPPQGDQNGTGPSTACPSTASQSWNFYPQTCQAEGTSGECQSCNVVPAQNGAAGQCVNPDSPTGASWCLDQPPASQSGYSRLCRQVPFDTYYAGATSWDTTPPNQACQPQGSVWANYQLITTQWSTGLGGTTCPNVQDKVYDGNNVITGVIEPKVTLAADDVRSYLANTSMESYERSTCMGCHSKSTVNEASGTPGTDFVYFLGLEVPGFESSGGQ